MRAESKRAVQVGSRVMPPVSQRPTPSYLPGPSTWVHPGPTPESRRERREWGWLCRA